MKLAVAVVGAIVITLLIWLSILWATSPTPKPEALLPGWSGPLPDDTLWWFWVLLPGEPKPTDTTIKLNFANELTCQEARRAVFYVLDTLEVPLHTGDATIDLRLTECQ